MDQQLDSLLAPAEPEDRRQFLKTSLTAGFALAVQPVTAATITTDTNGLTAGEVKIPMGDVEIPGYRAMPEKGARFPIVLVVQEIFGVHEHIKDLCRRLAKTGYCAVAPELYARQGDVSKIENFQQIIREVVSKVPDQQVMSDLDKTAEWAAKTQKGDASKLAVTGFCWGGRIVWLYAAHNPRLKAGAAWYGRLVPTPGQPSSPLQPRQPIEVVKDLKAPVLGLYGAKDRGISVESVEQMRAALKDAGSKSEILLYADSDHGFNADYRPSYNEKDAKDAWAKMLDWFQKHGAR
ncbi:MAG: dienelactone hydrolase family protein [Bryobacteraceae bacterium]|nr:dienelactone hydrolase family protein [Bryobacteraceae bacterium]